MSFFLGRIPEMLGFVFELVVGGVGVGMEDVAGGGFVSKGEDFVWAA